MKKSRKLSAWILFIIMFFFAILNDSSVMILDVPKLQDTKIAQGTLGVNEKSRKIDRTLLLITEDGKLKITCWIWPGRGGNCLRSIAKEEVAKLEGKLAKVYFYKARVGLFFHENRMLQIEIDNEVIKGYEEQKAEYLKSKAGYLYLYSIFTFLSFFWLLLTYLSNESKVHST